MYEDPQSILCQATDAASARPLEVIQQLWSGYGSIIRYGLTGTDLDRVVVQHVRFPGQARHPRGWNTDLFHRRKLRSYEVETAWYSRRSAGCELSCRVPRCFAVENPCSDGKPPSTRRPWNRAGALFIR